MTALCDAGKSHCQSLVLQDSLREMVTCCLLFSYKGAKKYPDKSRSLTFHTFKSHLVVLLLVWYFFPLHSKCSKRIIHIIGILVHLLPVSMNEKKIIAIFPLHFFYYGRCLFLIFIKKKPEELFCFEVLVHLLIFQSYLG